MARTLILIAILSLYLCTKPATGTYTGLVNKKVVRNVDLTSQLAKHSIDITIENTGNESPESVFIVLERELGDKLAYLKVTSSDNILNTKKEEGKKGEDILYRVYLPKKLEPGASIDMIVTMVFTHSMTPFPSHIKQNEKQSVIYSDNAYWYSLYKTESQKTKVKIPATSKHFMTEVKPSSFKGESPNGIATYGAYKNIAALSKGNLTIHFDNTKGFLTVVDVNRWVEVSSWGNIAVEEKYHMQHDGAKLKGSFSRYDFQTNPLVYGLNSIQTIHHYLPSVAADHYYRDDIGNISTSHLRPGSPQYLEMRPRFPLYGGWKSEFTVGYNLPTAPFLGTSYDDSSLYVLNFTFIADWEEKVAIDEANVTIVLPEGATDIEVFTPFDVTIVHASHVTYLDLKSCGRPTVILSKKNVVNEHNQNFQIMYRFSKSSMLFEPILLTLAFFSIFFFIIILVRVDLSLSKSVVSDSLIATLESVHQAFIERNKLHDRLENALKTYIHSKDEATYEKEARTVEHALTRIRNEVTKHISDITHIDPTSASKLTELEAKQTAKEDSQKALHKFTSLNKIKSLSQNFKEEHSKLKLAFEEALDDVEADVEELLGPL